MIAPIVAAFFAGVFATLIVIFTLDNREKSAPRAPRPWQTITNAEGSTEITGNFKPGPMGAICSALLRSAATSKHLTSGPAMDQQVEGKRYRVFVSWRMVFTVDPQAPAHDADREPPKTPRPAPPSMVKRG